MSKLAHEHLYRQFDAIRGLSAFIVFIAHINQIFFQRLLGTEHTLVILMGTLARDAVLVFFLLSGYLITQSIRLNIERNDSFDLTEYGIARLARIYPPLIGALIICTAVWGVIVWFDLPGRVAYGLSTDLYRARDVYGFKIKEFATSLIMYGGMTSVDGPLWTLYIEAQMYVVAAGIAIWFGSKTLRSYYSRLLFSGVALLALTLAIRFPLFVAVWLMGAAANLFPITKRVAKKVMMILSIVILLVIIFQPRWLGSESDSIIGQSVQVVCCAMFCCVMFFAPPKWRYPNWIVFFGKFSYSIYVIHWPLLMLSLSITQIWMGSSYLRTVIVSFFAVLLITILSIGFSQIFERQSFYRWLLRSIIKYLRSLSTKGFLIKFDKHS